MQPSSARATIVHDRTCSDRTEGTMNKIERPNMTEGDVIEFTLRDRRAHAPW